MHSSFAFAAPQPARTAPAPATMPGRRSPPPVAPAPAATLALLGSPRLCVADGRELRLQYRKGWALLAWLLAHPAQSQRRARLAALLWPRLPEPAALINLRQVLCDLNQKLSPLLGSSPLVCDRYTVRWCPTPRLRVDVEHLGAGVIDAPAEAFAAPHDGELLGGLYLDDCDEFNDWLQAMRTRLAREQDRALEARREQLVQAGRIDEAVAVARQLAAREPWDEPRCRALMRVLALAGEHQRAMDAYEELASALRKELGTEPQPESRAMYVGIRASQRACELALQDHALGG